MAIGLWSHILLTYSPILVFLHEMVTCD